METRPRFGFVCYFQTIHTPLMVSHSLHSQASNGLLTSLSNMLPHFSFTNSFLTQSLLLTSLLSHSLFLPSFWFIPIKSAAFLTPPCRLWSHPLTCLYKIGIPLTFKVPDYLSSSLFRICCLAYFSFAGSCPTLTLYLTRFLTLSPSEASAALQPQIKLPHKVSRSCVSSVSSLPFLYSNFCPTTTCNNIYFIHFITG